MIKRSFVTATFCIGLALCIFNSSAFITIGVVLGLAAIAGGVCFFGGIFFDFSGKGSIVAGVSLCLIGLLIIILCIFVKVVAVFLGGIITVLSGIIILPLMLKVHRLVLPFSIGLMGLGMLMLFAPSLSSWICALMGIGFIVYSGVLLVEL